MQAADDGADIGTYHPQRGGRRDRKRRGVLQRARLPRWLGLAPKQTSTRDCTMGKVSKQSNRYLRVLFVRSNAPTRGRIHFGSPETEIARCLADAG